MWDRICLSAFKMEIPILHILRPCQNGPYRLLSIFNRICRFLVESGAKTKVDKLERIQKRAIRCADLGKPRGSDYNDLMELYGIEPLWKRRKHYHLSVMY